MRTPVRIAIAVVSALALTFAISDFIAERRVRYTLPKDFKGVVAIAERERGVESEKRSYLWKYEIPPSGILATTDASIFERWHTAEAMYTDGTILPVYGMDEGTIGSKGVMLFPLETSGDRIWYLFVGTEEEYNQNSSLPRPQIPE